MKAFEAEPSLSLLFLPLMLCLVPGSHLGEAAGAAWLQEQSGHADPACVPQAIPSPAMRQPVRSPIHLPALMLLCSAPAWALRARTSSQGGRIQPLPSSAPC